MRVRQTDRQTDRQKREGRGGSNESERQTDRQGRGRGGSNGSERHRQTDRKKERGGGRVVAMRVSNQTDSQKDENITTAQMLVPRLTSFLLCFTQASDVLKTAQI